jgi:hypothetical protein
MAELQMQYSVGVKRRRASQIDRAEIAETWWERDLLSASSVRQTCQCFC